MLMQTLRECVEEYKNGGKALGHFNVSDSNQLRAIALAARETGLPVVVGLSEGEREFFPLAHARAIINAYNTDGLQMYLNADHTYSVEKVKEAIAAGVDSIVVDGAKLPFIENIALLKTCVEEARASTREILIEGELGYIGTSSSVMDTLPEGAAITEEMMTTSGELHDLVMETHANLVAPAVGNIHGVVRSGQPKLSIARIAELATTAGAPLVLHGGSGSSDGEFVQAITAGIVMIHINTDLRVIYHDTLAETLSANSKETTPYKFLAPSVGRMQDFVAQKMRLFAKSQ